MSLSEEKMSNLEANSGTWGKLIQDYIDVLRKNHRYFEKMKGKHNDKDEEYEGLIPGESFDECEEEVEYLLVEPRLKNIEAAEKCLEVMEEGKEVLQKFKALKSIYKDSGMKKLEEEGVWPNTLTQPTATDFKKKFFEAQEAFVQYTDELRDYMETTEAYEKMTDERAELIEDEFPN